MSATLVLAVPFYAADFVLDSLSRLVSAYPGILDLDRWLTLPSAGSGLSPSTATLLEPTVVCKCFSPLWFGVRGR